MEQNCWEFKRCGREPGGSNIARDGVCPTSLCRPANGIHYGRNGGRACWALDGTMCDDRGPMNCDQKMLFCAKCAFYHAVHQEECAGVISVPEIRTLVYGHP